MLCLPEALSAACVFVLVMFPLPVNNRLDTVEFCHTHNCSGMFLLLKTDPQVWALLELPQMGTV